MTDFFFESELHTMSENLLNHHMACLCEQVKDVMRRATLLVSVRPSHDSGVCYVIRQFMVVHRWKLRLHYIYL